MSLPPHLVSIQGVPRSGTSWLGQILKSAPEVEFRFQPLFSYAFKNRLNEHSSQEEILRFFADILHTDDAFVLQRDPKIHVDYPEFAPGERTTHLVMKEVRYNHIISNMLMEVPELRIIGLVRDPRAVIHSWANAPREFTPAWDLHTEWRKAEKKNMGRPEEFFGFDKWKEVADLFLQLSREYPDRFLLVNYDDLNHDAITTTQGIFRFLDLPFGDATRQFITESRSKQGSDANSIYRTKQDDRGWVGHLDPMIVKAIEEELRGTALETFLR